MANKPEIEIADIFRGHSHKLRNLSSDQHKVIRDITSCRTEALGGHVLTCDHCGDTEISYNSCRNRHCPKCQSMAKEQWVMKREQELLPVSYFHVVFTTPRLLAPIALQNKKVVYGLYFKAVSQTLKEVAANPVHIGAKIGFISVLHTWDQKLLHHPHIHCIVPGGGLGPDNSRWISCSKDYFLPINILSKVFRGKLLSFLEKAHKKHKLQFFNKLAYLKDPYNFKHFLNRTCEKDWVTYSKRPFAGPQQVIKYLSRYTHRIAISNHRIIKADAKTVTFRFRDRKNGNVEKTLTLDVVDFMRRFLLHILPSGFMKIRHYGFLGNPLRKSALALCRVFFDIESQNEEAVPQSWVEIMVHITGKDPTICSKCGKGHMKVSEEIMPIPPPALLKAG